MRQSRPGDTGGPTPEYFAAYVDGQLAPALRRGVEKWLRDHPEATAEIEEQRQLARLWQATTPAEPEAANWATIFARVDSGFFRSRLPGMRTRRLIRLGAAGGLAAAMLLVALCPHGPGPSEDPAGVEPLAVVSPDDVEIISLRAADRVTLVVGVPPVTEPLMLASPGDVELENVEPDADGMVPDIHLDEGSLTVMIVAPLGAVPVPVRSP